jgi:glycosyltransferase involved in cell wall biosynthesis
MASLVLIAGLSVVFLIAVANMAFWPRVKPRLIRHDQRVSVLIPARDEGENIVECLQAVVEQGDVVREVLVYNDHSSDRTADLVRAFGASHPVVRLVEPAPLQSGWTGKNFACARLADEASSPWMLFLDADARLRKNATALMLAEATERRVTLLSAWPGLDLVGFWEKLLMPMLNFLVFSIYPAPFSLKSRSPALGLAHGACLLIQRETYRRVGGHASVRDQIFEDTQLARLWRRMGERSLCLDGRDVVRVRMYGSLRAIWAGFLKNFYPGFRRKSSFWAFIAMHAVFFLLPFLLAPYEALQGGVVGPYLTAAIMVLAMRFLMAWRFRYPAWSALLHPVAELFLIALGVSSWWKCSTGKGVLWKGRTYLAGHVNRAL